MVSPVVLETRGLTMRFGGVVAVDRVDFTLRERELRCLIGPNGAGKSTFFKCLTGQLRPTHGDVLLRDRHVGGLEPHEIANHGVGIKTQVPNVFNGLSAQENIWVSARRGRTPRMTARIVEEVMARVGIADLAARTVGELAHGQRQLVEGRGTPTQQQLVLHPAGPVDEGRAPYSPRQVLAVSGGAASPVW